MRFCRIFAYTRVSVCLLLLMGGGSECDTDSEKLVVVAGMRLREFQFMDMRCNFRLIFVEKQRIKYIAGRRIIMSNDDEVACATLHPF